jgi:hypothetical protein
LEPEDVPRPLLERWIGGGGVVDASEASMEAGDVSRSLLERSICGGVVGASRASLEAGPVSTST